MTRSQLINEIENAINGVISGFATKYISYTDEKGNYWTVRVSDHAANPSRVSENFISLVIDVKKEESDDSESYGAWGVNKKDFQDIDNQFFLDECGSFTEQFRDVEEMVNYIID